MSQKGQQCSVSIEPLDKDKMESLKKKSGKSRQTTPVPQEAPKEAVGTSEKPKEEKAPEPSQSQDTTKNAVNGKGKSKKESKKDGPSKSQSPKKDKPLVTNGVTDVALNSNGTAHAEKSPLAAGEANPDVIEEEGLVPNSEQDNDELFPELIYDETSDNECNFDSSSPDFSPVGRSVTRRSQAKVIPTPETPQMLHPKQDVPNDTSPSPAIESPLDGLDRSSSRNSPQPDISLREKVLRMNKDSPNSGSSSPKVIKDADGGKDDVDEEVENVLKNGTEFVEISNSKCETNYSKSRIKVSPYRRSSRLSEQYSTMANYSGNNSTQDTDIVGDISSSSHDRSPAKENLEGSSTLSSSHESFQGENSSPSYQGSYRSIKGRKSYRPLREISLLKLAAQRQKYSEERTEEQMSTTVSSANATIGSASRDTTMSELQSRWTPVGHVVGRKRRSSGNTPIESTTTCEMSSSAVTTAHHDVVQPTIEPPSKRQKLFGFVSTPLRGFRDKMTSSTPIVKSDENLRAQNSTTIGEEANENMLVDDEVLNAGGTVPLKPKSEHKWCSVM